MEYKRIIIGLDFTDIDESVLRYSNFISKFLKFEVVYFLHVSKSLETEKSVRDKYADEMEKIPPLDESLASVMREEVAAYFPGSKKLECSFHILEGKPAEQIIHWSIVKNADLIIMGKKDVGKGSGLFAKKVARLSTRSMLFVNENADCSLENILVPIDFSDNSAKALEFASTLKGETDKLQLLHVYDVPAERYKVLRSFEQIQLMFEESAKEGFSDFLSRLKFMLKDYEIDFVQDDYMNTPKQIYKYVKNNLPKILVIGAKGHSKFELMLVGSVTEQLLISYDFSPILIVKNSAK